MTSEHLPAYVRGLQQKRAYPGRVDSIQLIQTHISYVFLVDDQVYKLKKPIDLGFVDFTTLEKRRAACEAEVRLNRRGCPGGVYQGVVPITLDNGRYRVGGDGDGEVIEYAVHMKRLPQGRMMDVLLEQGKVDLDMVGRVAARLAELHREAESGPEITRQGSLENVERNWLDNLDAIEAFVGRTLSRVREQRIDSYVRGFLQAEAPLLRRREQQGWVRDCHGDLRSDAVCFDDDVPGGICIYDCIEFNAAFRYSDTGLDAGFLAMDLDYRGRPDLSDLFIGLYAAAMGDAEVPLLLHFYKCYRACVRGKVESLLLVDAGVPRSQKSAARKRAQAYFRLAESYARRRPVHGLVMVTGPSGSGKSVLAGCLASRLGAVLLSTDMLRRGIFHQPGRDEPVGEGKYSPESRGRVYGELADKAAEYLREGRAVVVDGTFIERAQREPLLRLARETRTRLLLVQCDASDEVVRQRQQRRQSQAWSTSEGRYEVYLEQKQHQEPPDEVDARHRLVVDTTQPQSQQIDAVTSKLKTLR